MPDQLCPCGKPLHYSHPALREIIERLIGQHGERVAVAINGRTWMVPRHYIALHGLRAVNLPELGFEEVRCAAH